LLVGLLLLLGLALTPTTAQVDTGVIRLGGGSGEQEPSGDPESGPATVEEGSLGGHRAFDHDAFQQRLESSWFRRRALLAEGRADDAQRQGELIRNFCAEEGVERLEPLAGAALLEVHRYLEEGSCERALTALALAESFDPGRAQIHVARAVVLWKSGDGILAATGALARGARAALMESWATLSVVHRLSVAVVAGML